MKVPCVPQWKKGRVAEADNSFILILPSKSSIKFLTSIQSLLSFLTGVATSSTMVSFALMCTSRPETPFLLLGLLLGLLLVFLAPHWGDSDSWFSAPSLVTYKQLSISRRLTSRRRDVTSLSCSSQCFDFCPKLQNFVYFGLLWELSICSNHDLVSEDSNLRYMQS